MNMNIFLKEKKMTNLNRKGLVLAVSTAITTMVITSVTQASDVQIYQNPTVQGKTIIMLMLDTSQSMRKNADAGPKSNEIRSAVMERAIHRILNGGLDDNGNTVIPLADDVIVGLSIFDNTSSTGRGMITVPARQLNSIVPIDENPYGTLNENQRSLLSRAIRGYGIYKKTDGSDWSPSDASGIAASYVYDKGRSEALASINPKHDAGTPSVSLYAETVSYLLGTRPKGTGSDGKLKTTNGNSTPNSTAENSGFTNSYSATKIGNYYNPPLTAQILDDATRQCSAQGIFFFTDGTPTVLSSPQSLPLLKNTLSQSGSDSSFDCDNSDLSTVYYSKLSGWGADSPFSSSLQAGYSDRSALACIGKFAKRIVNKEVLTAIPLDKRIYTSIVAFGADWKNNVENWLVSKEIRKWGYLGMMGSLDGYDDPNSITGLTNTSGFTVANDTAGVANAMSNFVSQLKTSFNAASFGTYVVPADALSTSSSYSAVFAPQFQPRVSGSGSTLKSTQQLWLGNLKKYKLNSSGVMVDSQGRTVLRNTGGVSASTQDFWNAASINDGADALQGGALSELTVPNTGSNVLSSATNITDIKTRPLYINATIPTEITSADKNKVMAANGLTKLDTQTVFSANHIDDTAGSGATAWRQNVYQPYLLSALGYKLTKTALEAKAAGYVWDTVDKVKSLPVMQQMGGVLHSDPLLVTTEAKYDANTGTILANSSTVTNRKDYIVTGTMQGLLHMVNQNTGKEEFAFLPNEILQDTSRRDGLLDVSNTQTNTDHPYYGIDAPWASWVEYRVDTTNKKFVADKANIYGGMRMGGRSYYGLDIKNPADPKFLFQINPVIGTIHSSTTDVLVTDANKAALQAMGQSWSKPTLAKIRFGNLVKKVMIVGGGYDDAYETDGYQPTSTTVNAGAGVYIFDATTGALLWNARAGTNSVTTTDVKNNNLKYSVVSQIKAFDRDADGLVDNLYFGDLGGQVFRVDLNNAYGTESTNFGRVNLLANFSNSHQRFYEMPSLSIHNNNGSRFGVVGIGSGNRSFPLNTSNGFDNRVYAIYDYDIASTNLYRSTFAKTSNLAEADLLNWTDITISNVANLVNNTKKGWYYTLRKTNAENETENTGTVKALNGYLVVAHTDKFSDFYVSLYNPHHASTQQPDTCTGGITGSSVVRRLCLPYGVCGDVTDSKNFSSNKTDANVGNASDGISKVNAGGFSNGVNNLITLLPDVGKDYKTTKLFQSSNWYER